MTMPEKHTPFNPLNIPNVALSLALEVLEQTSHPLPPAEPFEGTGIYLLYYMGNLPLYKQLTKANSKEGGPKIPIYVGQADQKGASKGIIFTPSSEKAIYNRLRNHAESIKLADNLNCADFRTRYLIIEDAFILLAESVLISVFRPLWNQVVKGFGNNPTGGPRSKQAKSDWDVLHPGRVRGCGEPRKPESEIAADVRKHLRKTFDREADSELHRIRERIKKYRLA
jgi:hypothetical protein